MPQIKSEKLESGHTVEYWVPQTVIYNIADNKIVVSYAGYMDEAHCKAGGAKTLERSFEVSADQDPELKAAVSAYIEARLLAELNTPKIVDPPVERGFHGSVPHDS